LLAVRRSSDDAVCHFPVNMRTSPLSGSPAGIVRSPDLAEFRPINYSMNNGEN